MEVKDTIKINKTGETMTFSRHSEDELEFICDIPAESEGPPKHRHPFQSETFEVLEGVLILHAGKKKRILKKGQSATVAANTIHTYTTPNKEAVKYKATLKPPLQTEWQFREIFASCNRRKSAQPNPVESAYIIHAVDGDYAFTGFLRILQIMLFPVLAFAGKILGIVKVKPL